MKKSEYQDPFIEQDATYGKTHSQSTQKSKAILIARQVLDSFSTTK